MRQYFLTWWIDHSLALALHNSYTPSLINVCALSPHPSPPLLRDGRNPFCDLGGNGISRKDRAWKKKSLELVSC